MFVKYGRGAVVVVADWPTSRGQGKGGGGRGKCPRTGDDITAPGPEGDYPYVGESGAGNSAWELAVDWKALGLDPSKVGSLGRS